MEKIKICIEEFEEILCIIDKEYKRRGRVFKKDRFKQLHKQWEMIKVRNFIMKLQNYFIWKF